MVAQTIYEDINRIRKGEYGEQRMSQAKCFECEEVMDVGRSMEDLLKARFPIFCSIKCSLDFPDNHTKDFDDRINKLMEQDNET